MNITEFGPWRPSGRIDDSLMRARQDKATMTTPDAGQRLIEDLRNPNMHFAWDDRLAAAKEIERLRGVEAAVEKLLEWVGPLAGDNCDPISAEIEVRTVAEVRAAIVASRSTGAADVGEDHG